MATMTPTNNQGELDSGWVPAPASSHVAAFRLLDRGGSEFGASSEIWVRYRDGSEYAYHGLGTHDNARAVFALLEKADHPGSVIHEHIKKPRVPYRRVL